MALMASGERARAVDTTTVVRPTAMNGWGFFSEGPVGSSQSGELVTGPATPPLGSGSAELSVDGTGRMSLGTLAFAGTRLDQLTELSYSAYRSSVDAGNNLAVTLQFDADFDLTDADTTFQGRLVFEPYLTSGGGTVAEDTWQQRDALAGNWFASRAPFNASCSQAAPCSTAQVLSLWPDVGLRASIGTLLFRAGGPWAGGFVGNMDSLTVGVGTNSTTFDFEAGPGPACTFTTVGTTMSLNGDCYTEQTITVPNGFTLDGQGFTITAIDPVAGHFVGGIVADGGASANVTNLGVTTDSLADVCDGGDNRLRGILFDGASGSITNNTVTNIRQATTSGCQEGNGIEVRNAPFTTAGPDLAVTISGNVVTGYQKTGIIANGSVAAMITTNTVTGDGPVSYIAQNGIQVGFGGTATVQRNTVTGNSYTGPDVACGLLLFEADGVKSSKNAFSANERDNCNFGKGGGQFNPNP